MYNDTGRLITSLTLTALLDPGLTDVTFSCGSGANNPFFLNCSSSYNATNGDLTINFFGVNPADGDELTGTDDEVGEQEGIPPVVGICLLHPDSVSEGCADVGHFAIVFTDNFQAGGANGWTSDLSQGGTPTFAAPQYTTSAPEPSSLLLLGASILALAGGSRLRPRAKNAS